MPFALQESFVASAETEVGGLQAAAQAAEAKAAELEAQLTKVNDQLLRLSADFDNFRKRTVRCTEWCKEPPTS